MKITMPFAEQPVVLTIAGSDSGAGAGIQADLLTFAAHNVFGTTAITCLTAQNPDGITAIELLPAPFVAEQIQQVHRYFQVCALKTGMLYSAEIIGVVADFLRAQPKIPAVVDPVMVATSGSVLLKPEALSAVREMLLPLAALVTPNLNEVAALLGVRPSTPGEMTEAAEKLVQTYGVPFLVKGGHLPGGELTDVLAEPGCTPHTFTSQRVDGVDTHGSGCTLSAAIAANLAKGVGLDSAVEAARMYLWRALDRGLVVGDKRMINHRP